MGCHPSHWLSYFSRWLLHHQPGNGSWTIFRRRLVFQSSTYRNPPDAEGSERYPWVAIPSVNHHYESGTLGEKNILRHQKVLLFVIYIPLYTMKFHINELVYPIIGSYGISPIFRHRHISNNLKSIWYVDNLTCITHESNINRPVENHTLDFHLSHTHIYHRTGWWESLQEPPYIWW